jgi:hypothetical protein
VVADDLEMHHRLSHVFSPVRWSVCDAWTAIGAGLEELQVAFVASRASARRRDKLTCCAFS